MSVMGTSIMDLTMWWILLIFVLLSTAAAEERQKDTFCIGNPLVVRNEKEFRVLNNAKCTIFLGSLIIRWSDPGTQLSVVTITGYLVVDGIFIQSWNDSFPNLERVLGIRQYTSKSSPCTILISNSVFGRNYANKTDIHVHTNPPNSPRETQTKKGAENDCFYNNFNEEGLEVNASVVTFNETEEETIRDLNWTTGAKSSECPRITVPTESTTYLTPDKRSNCFEAYDCAKISHDTSARYNIFDDDLPCNRYCNGTIFISTVEAMCVVQKGCRVLNGSLEIYVNNIDSLSKLSPDCKLRLNISKTSGTASTPTRLDDIGGPLHTLFKDLKVIKGKLVLTHTRGIAALEFLPALMNIQGANGKGLLPFDECPFRKRAAVVFSSTSLVNISRLQSVNFSTANSSDTNGISASFNDGLCNDTFYELCNNTENLWCGNSSTIHNNGLQSFCEGATATLNSKDVLTWQLQPRTSTSECSEDHSTSPCALGYGLYYTAASNGTDTNPRDVCLGVGTGWTQLALEDNGTANVSKYAPVLPQCQEIDIVVCGYALFADGRVAGFGHASPNTTFMAPRRSVQVVVQFNITGYESYNITVSLPRNKTDEHCELTALEGISVNATALNQWTSMELNATEKNGQYVVDWSKDVLQHGGRNLAFTKVMVCGLGNDSRCRSATLKKFVSELNINECVEEEDMCQGCEDTIGGYICHGEEDEEEDGYNPRYFIILLVLLIVPVLLLLILRKRDRSKLQKRISDIERRYRHQFENPVEGYEEDPVWELEADSLSIIREVGEGAFGKVYQGTLATVEDGDLTVAIKTLSVCENSAQKNAFLAEASIMKKFESPYVMRLMGLVSTASKPLVVMEFMAEGDLRGYLMKCRPEEQQFTSRPAPSAGEPTNEPPSGPQFKQWALQLAKGMVHLNEKRFVHRDLAARNCMLAADLTLKIGDFGFTRDIYQSDYYRKTGRGVLPVRWLGPECLRDGLFISASDVWSYGIVLWEMATLGDQPYPGKSHEEVMNFIIAGQHMEPPIILHEFPDVLITVMEKCWQFTPQSRPTFDYIVSTLDDSPYQQPVA